MLAHLLKPGIVGRVSLTVGSPTGTTIPVTILSSPGATAYEYRLTTSNPGLGLWGAWTTLSAATITGLAGGTTYYFQVRGVRGFSRGVPSLVYSAATSAGWTTIFSQTLNANDTGWANYTARNMLTISGGAGGGGLIRVTFEASSAASYQVDNASIGISTTADSGATDDGAPTTATPVELLFSSAHGFTLSAGQTITSDSASLSGFTSSNKLVIIEDVAASNGNPRYINGLGAPNAGGSRLSFASSANSYNSAAAVGAGSGLAGWCLGINKIEVQ